MILIRLDLLTWSESCVPRSGFCEPRRLSVNPSQMAPGPVTATAASWTFWVLLFKVSFLLMEMNFVNSLTGQKYLQVYISVTLTYLHNSSKKLHNVCLGEKYVYNIMLFSSL